MTADAVADVVVVGAGPAGAAAAATLARAGRNVVLADKATFPRDKCCGDGLTALALRQLDALGLDPARVASWLPIHEAVIHAPGGRVARLPLPAGPGLHAAVARRTDLDAALVKLAGHAGAVTAAGHGLRAIAQGADRVEVDLDGLGRVAARFVIAADGMWSPTRRLLGLDVAGYRGDWHAFRQYLGVDGPAASQLHVLFEEDLLPGYFWAFPVPGGTTNAGFGLPRGGRLPVGDMGGRWKELLARPSIRDVLGDRVEPEAPVKALPIPARLGGLPLASGRVLFVGDAAAATDPMSGEGIGQALRTGVLAAEAVISAGPHRPHLAEASYRSAVHRELLVDHRFAHALSALLGSRRRADLALRTVDLNGWTRRNFARWLFEDYPRAVLATPRRWDRPVFTRAGAFTSR